MQGGKTLDGIETAFEGVGSGVFGEVVPDDRALSEVFCHLRENADATLTERVGQLERSQVKAGGILVQDRGGSAKVPANSKHVRLEGRV